MIELIVRLLKRFMQPLSDRLLLVNHIDWYSCYAIICCAVYLFICT